MSLKLLALTFCYLATVVHGKTGRCDQSVKDLTPSKNDGIYKLHVETKGNKSNLFLPDQTYVVTLVALKENRPFMAFMITAEDPTLDPDDDPREVDVGILKTLDTDLMTRYSWNCYATVENTDYSDKTKIQIHWVSPKDLGREKVRIRAMVMENDEVWYSGDDDDNDLSIILDKDDTKPIDSPPLPVKDSCDLCSEARYEIFFRGRWSTLSHPKKYPTKFDGNGYSEMIGASHAIDYTLWLEGRKATNGLKQLAEEANVTALEREIIRKMSERSGTRTLIRGKKHIHPLMSKPSHSLFRVDRFHHMFSIAVAMRPSPDWFLGVTRFELCDEDGWLESSEVPMYPWDAGTMDGVSYESIPSVTQPVGSIARVAFGSFDKESPFHRMNLNDLKAFATLEVRRLDVYPLPKEECENAVEEEQPSQMNNNEEADDTQEEPNTLESKIFEEAKCSSGEWSEWSPCLPSQGYCGVGSQTRSRISKPMGYSPEPQFQSYQELQDANNVNEETNFVNNNNCYDVGAGVEVQQCFVMCDK